MPDNETRGEQDTLDRPRAFEGDLSRSDEGVSVMLTYDELDSKAVMAQVKSPKAGAVVLFAGMCLAWRSTVLNAAC